MSQQETWGFGLNSHNQITSSTSKDVNTPHRIHEGQEISVVYAGWSDVLFRIDDQLFYHGHHGGLFRADGINLPNPDGEIIQSLFGTTSGLKGGINRKGQLALFDLDGFTLQGNSDTCPLLSHIAVAMSERVAVSLAREQDEDFEVLEFENMPTFITWYITARPNTTGPLNSATSNRTSSRSFRSDISPLVYTGRGYCAQLVAGATYYTLLSVFEEHDVPQSTVYTWGDARNYRCLCRIVDADHPADEPGKVTALEGLTIEKIRSGGYMSGALSNERDLYLWGQPPPGSGLVIAELRGNFEDEVRLADIPFDQLMEDPTQEVLDFSIGNGFIVAVADGNRVFVAGDNTNGQLGIEGDRARILGPFMKKWEEVEEFHGKALDVVCGEKTTYIKATVGVIVDRFDSERP